MSTGQTQTERVKVLRPGDNSAWELDVRFVDDSTVIAGHMKKAALGDIIKRVTGERFEIVARTNVSQPGNNHTELEVQLLP